MPEALYWITEPAPFGRLATASRPRGGDWLHSDLEIWKRAGVQVVVSLLTSEENKELELQDESRACLQLGLAFRRLPIPDRGLPPSIPAFSNLVVDLHQERQAGQNVLIHCRQGVGRSSMMAAAVLFLEARNLQDPWERIRSARGRPVPDVPEQRQWVDRILQDRMFNTHQARAPHLSDPEG